jgi:hypothetical protein
MRFYLLVFLLSIRLLPAAPLERDLGGGLVYYRVRNLPADLPEASPAPKRTFVLDLRYTPGNGAAADAVAAWLKTHATNRTPVFVLANASTSSGLLALLARRNPNEGVLLLGAASPGFSPDIPITIAPEAERQAYDFFETHADANALLKENTSKVRNDEARLSREHASGTNVEEALLESTTPTRLDDKIAMSPATPPQPVDYVLQRALHLHRTLLALKKI